MPAQKLLIVFFKDIDKEDIPLVGGKGANLGEMVNAGFPVPYGFAITVASYDKFIEQNGISKKINELLKQVDTEDPQQLNMASKKIQKIINESEIPEEVRDQTIAGYKKLSGKFNKALVAVRSSATAEDLPGASFAGQQATFLDIKGYNNLLVAVRECWASLFTARAIFYRAQNKIDNDKVKISVIIQKMVQSKASGVMFSIDPVTNEKDKIIIEAIWGLGEYIVQGSVLPDKYVVQKDTFLILSKEISEQNIALVRAANGTKEVKVPKKLSGKQKITDDEIIKLAKLSEKLQKHYYFPQDTEWAKSDGGSKLLGSNKGEIFIVQTRPVTTIGEVKKKKDKTFFATSTPVLIGTAASPGMGTGPVKVLSSPKEISKVVRDDILVAKMTSPDYVPAMKKASAIVTDEGGLTSHAAIVSRELGVPCVVGTKKATKVLKENEVVTVDGSKGYIYEGSQIVKEMKANKVIKKKYKKIKTATHIYVNLAEPERAKEISKMNVDGVGLLRAEFMIANIGMHPKEAIKQKKQNHFIDKLASDLEIFCKAFNPRPVVYRATDFKTNEYRTLAGGEAWEPKEANPMLGFRGAYRYITNPDVFNLELQAMKLVRQKYKNLWLMIPFVRSPEELTRIRRIVASEGLFESPTFKFWMMVEIPINVILIDEFIKVGIDGVSIGSNDLTMLITGTDRDNAEVAESFNERSPAVLWSLRRVIRHCNRAKITSSICGQAPSVYEDFVAKLIKYGINSISVNPDAVDRVRSVVSSLEKELVNGRQLSVK
jgi:pyruvate,water dikinase